MKVVVLAIKYLDMNACILLCGDLRPRCTGVAHSKNDSRKVAKILQIDKSNSSFSLNMMLPLLVCDCDSDVILKMGWKIMASSVK